MRPASVKEALPVVGLVGIAGLFLPGYDKSWQASPRDEDFRERLRAGETAYFAYAFGLGLLASYAQGSAVPLVLSVGWALMAVGMHEYALRHRQTDAQ